MSDPSLEEDSLISQDDIDKLLASSSIEEAEEKLLNPDTEAANEPEEPEELAELSQDDIDSLINLDVSDEESPVPQDNLDDDDMELISQDDIDSLMNSSLPEEAPPPGKDLMEDLVEERLEETLEVPLEDPDEAFEMISQDDINDLMSSQAAETQIQDNKEEGGLLVAEDVIDLAPASITSEKTDKPGAADNGRGMDNVIDESEAVDALDSLISQETLDELENNFDSEALSEPVILDEDPITSEKDELTDDENSDDDIQDFLNFDSDMDMLDLEEDDKGDVTQEDIDALLLDSVDDEDDVLISQDDIDTLLMAADQEDEDVLGDLMDNDFGSSLDELDEDATDEGVLADEKFDEYGDEDQIVLERYDENESLESTSEGERTGLGSGWYKSKLVIACASALIVLGITVPATYFMFFSGNSDSEIQQLDPVENYAAETEREIEIETVDVVVEQQGNIQNPGNMILKDFVILASDQSKDLVYVSTDISIDYSDQEAYHEIQNNLPFYRDLIYDSINKSLVSEKRDEITEADILWSVETSLKKVLPGHSIDRVSFKSFKAS